MKSGNIEDYLKYRNEIKGSDNTFDCDDRITSGKNDYSIYQKDIEVLSNISNPDKLTFGANNEKTIKGYYHPRSGLWRK